MSQNNPKHRFFVSPQSIKENTFTVGDHEYHHIVDVLRYKESDQIILFDGQGNEYSCVIVSIDKDKKVVMGEIKESKSDISSEVPFILVQALVKSSKMDFIIQKATELGVTHIYPIETEYSIVHLDEERRISKTKKWNTIIVEASKQCGRTTLPVISSIKSISEVIKDLEWVDKKYICHPDKNEEIKKDKNLSSVAIMIGPEGGFSDKEYTESVKAGWKQLGLGKNILRAETAAIASLSVIGYTLGLWKKHLKIQ